MAEPLSGPVDHILVERLAALYDPWGALGLTGDEPLPPPIPHFVPHEERTRAYHLGRIAFFREEALRNALKDPLEIDNDCWGGRVNPIPIIIDGNHRFCGAILANAERVPVSYSGRMDLLNYLLGKRKTCPRE